MFSHWVHWSHMAGHIQNVFRMYPLGILGSHNRVYSKCTQHLITGHIGVTCCLCSQCVHNVPSGYLGPCPQCHYCRLPRDSLPKTPSPPSYWSRIQHPPLQLRTSYLEPQLLAAFQRIGELLLGESGTGNQEPGTRRLREVHKVHKCGKWSTIEGLRD